MRDMEGVFMTANDFVLDTACPRYRIWGTDSQERFYFAEWLPAFFERTIQITKRAGQGTLRWLFTGSRGRAEVRLENGEIELLQIYTDSYALYPKDQFDPDNMYLHRHPEKVWEESRAVCPDFRTVALRFDRNLRLTLFLDGRPFFIQRCTLDFTRHQLALEGSGCRVEGYLQPVSIREAVVRADVEQKHQVMEGFGGITSIPSYHMLSEEGKKRWWKYLKRYGLLIQREYPSSACGEMNHIAWDDRKEAVPHYYGNNFPVGEISDFTYNRKILEMGGEVWFEFWRYPDCVYENGEVNAQKLIGQILDYCRIAAEKTGKAPAVVGIQNEQCVSAEKLKEIVPALRKALDEAGFEQVSLSTCNGGNLSQGLEFLERFREYDSVWEKMDYTASNMYDFQDCFGEQEKLIPIMKQFREASGEKHFLSTEIAINKPPYQEDSYSLAFNLGILYHNNLTVMDACAICYCWLLMDVTEPSYGFTRTLFTVDSRRGFLPVPSGYLLRTFGAFSAHIAKGMRRITVECDCPDILCSGYQDETGHQTFVFLNQGTQACRLDLSRVMELGRNWKGELCDPYHENSEAVFDGQSFVLEPGAIYTLYWQEEEK